MVAIRELDSSSPDNQNGYGSVPAESEYSTKYNIDVKENEARLTNNAKHREEKRHSDSHRDHRIKEYSKQTKHLDHESRSSSKSNGKEKSHNTSSGHTEKSISRSSKSSSGKSSSKRRREEDSTSKSNKKEIVPHEIPERSASSSKQSEQSATDEHHPKAKKPKVLFNESIDGTMGASFSDALSMCNIGVTSKNKKKKKLKKLMESKPVVETSGYSEAVLEKHSPVLIPDALKTSPKTRLDISLNLPMEPLVNIFENYMCNIGGTSKNKKKKKLKTLMESKPVVETSGYSEAVLEKHSPVLIPDALKTSPKTRLDISLDLPMDPLVNILENYETSPINQNVMNCICPSSMPQKPASSNYTNLNLGITSKTMRTKVYSGVRTGALLTVPSLFDICIRYLQKNIDIVQYTGGVPFDVLRPVLERTTPQQLLNFEIFNAYLLEETDVLWQQHVGRNFRGKMKKDGESWRQMFLRCEDEKEKRLNILTKNIKISQQQSALPIKKTLLAYVDNVVKPPPNIQRKQKLYGTNDKLKASPASRVAALSSLTHNNVVAGGPRSKIERDLCDSTKTDSLKTRKSRVLSSVSHNNIGAEDPRLKLARELCTSTKNNSLKIKKAPLMTKTMQFYKKYYKR